jgi:hypothetical protein
MYAEARIVTGRVAAQGGRTWAAPSLLPTQRIQLEFSLACAEDLTQIRNFGIGFSYSVGNPSNQHLSKQGILVSTLQIYIRGVLGSNLYQDNGYLE